MTIRVGFSGHAETLSEVGDLLRPGHRTHRDGYLPTFLRRWAVRRCRQAQQDALLIGGEGSELRQGRGFLGF